MKYDRNKNLKDNLADAEREHATVKQRAASLGVNPKLDPFDKDAGMASRFSTIVRNTDILKAALGVHHLKSPNPATPPAQKPATESKPSKPSKPSTTSPLVFDCRHPITGKRLKETRHV